MKRLHLLVELESEGVLTVRILCLQCMSTWWTDEEDLERELKCTRCGHRAVVERDSRRVLR